MAERLLSCCEIFENLNFSEVRFIVIIGTKLELHFDLQWQTRTRFVAVVTTFMYDAWYDTLKLHLNTHALKKGHNMITNQTFGTKLSTFWYGTPNFQYVNTIGPC